MQNDPAVIVGMARTAIGAFQGAFRNVTAVELGASAIRGAVERAGLRPEDVQEVIIGNARSMHACMMPRGPPASSARS